MARKAVIFDSNVWIGFFNTADKTHIAAKKLFTTYTGHTIVIPEYVLLEVSTILKLQLGCDGSQRIITGLLQTEHIEVLPSVDYFHKTLKTFLTIKDKYLSFVDISLLILSKDFLIETFDKKLLKAIRCT